MEAAASTSVLIAGAGPVGLALACELGLRGVDCLLIEKRDGAITVPKQSMVSSRNMEFCRRWGVAREVRTAVWPESHPRDFVYLVEPARPRTAAREDALLLASARPRTSRRKPPARARRSTSIRSSVPACETSRA